MTMNSLPASFGKGGSNLTDGTLKAILQELQGLSISPVTGAAANQKMNIAAIRPEDTILAALLQGGVTTVGVAEVHSIDVDATGGTFRITYAGQTTADIAFNALAATVQAALEALSNVAPGDVVVTGGVGKSGGGTPYILTWSVYLGNVASPTTVVTGTPPLLTGGGASAAVTLSQGGTQQVGGQFTDDKANITIQSVKASGTITGSVGNPSNNETVTVAGVVYTYKITATAKTHVAIKANFSLTGDELARVINANDGGVNVVATSDGAGVVTITAATEGPGNGPAVSSSGGTMTVDSTDPGAVTVACASVVNTDTFTVNGVTFTFKTTPTVAYLDLAVPATNAAAAAAIVAALVRYQSNVGDLNVAATALDDDVTITAKGARTGNTIALAEAATNVAKSGVFLTGGTNTGGIKSTTDLTGESLLVYWYNKQ